MKVIDVTMEVKLILNVKVPAHLEEEDDGKLVHEYLDDVYQNFTCTVDHPSVDDIDYDGWEER